MGVTVPVLWNEMYLGSRTEDQAKFIMAVRGMTSVESLKQSVFDFNFDLVTEAINNNTSVRSLLSDRGISCEGYRTQLRDYQTVGVAFMYSSPRSVLADGCGLGKTVELAALLNVLKDKQEMRRFLIAVEKSAVGQTIVELTRFTGMRIVALSTEAAKLKRQIKNTDWHKVDGIVVAHSMLRSDTFFKWLALNTDKNNNCIIYDTLIIDESSVIKNSEAKVFRYTEQMMRLARRVHLLNATAFETHIMDIYNQMDVMDESLLPKRWRIEKEFCTHKQSEYWTRVNGVAKRNTHYSINGYKQQEVFKKRLALVYLGRSTQDVGFDKPNIYKIYEVEATDDMKALIKRGHRYQEVLNCPSLIKDSGVSMNRKEIPKLDRLCSLIEREFVNDKVMVYCFNIEAQSAIQRELEAIGKKAVILNGETDEEARYQIQKKFNDGEYDVVITNIKKSINLNGADVAIFYSIETNPAKMFQIASRIDRHTDDRTKTFVMLIYKDTAEYEYFTSVVKDRAKNAREIILDAKTTADYIFEAMGI